MKQGIFRYFFILAFIILLIITYVVFYKDEENVNEVQDQTSTVNTLLTSGSSSYFRTDLTDGSDTINDTDEQGEFTVGAEIQKKIDDTTTSTLIVYSNAVFASDARIVSGENYINAVLVYNNKDLVLNSIAYLNQREDSITIRKNTGTVTYTATQQEDTIIRIIIFTVPAVIVLVGIIVWQVRSRKK